MNARGLAMRAAIVLVAVSACCLARRLGGAADEAAALPRPAPHDASSATTAGERFEVAHRLVETAKSARVDAPDARIGLLDRRARTMRPPWFEAPPWVTRIALPSIDERSFDQRDALFAPAPASFTFRVGVPGGAKLAFAAGSVGATRDAIYVVTVVDAKGETHELLRHRLAPARGWTELSCSLADFAGQIVELRLSTELSPVVTGEGSRDAGEASGPPVSFWGNPTILARGVPRVPYDVLWIVVDSLGAVDALRERGVRFTHAYSAGSWTRPGTLAMLSGARSSALGVDAQRAAVPAADGARFYASDPPLLPLALRRRGVSTHAFVKDESVLGDAPLGIDVGFEHTADHRLARDALEIARDAASWIRDHRDTRFFAFVSYASARVPEASGSDEAVGALLQSLADAGLRERTIVIVTASRGSARIPLLIDAPGLVPEDREVKARVSNVDLAPTVAELLGLEPHPRASGRSLVGLARGREEPEERVIVSEDHGSRAILHGRHRLVVHEGAASDALFDVVDDPGERRDLSRDKPEIVAEMRARLDAALANARVAGSSPAREAEAKPAVVHLRFAGAGRPRRVAGWITVGDATTQARSMSVEPVEIARDAFKIGAGKIDLAFVTSASAAVGIDLVVDPPGAPVTWDFYLDDQPWPGDAVFGGPFGLPAPVLRRGLTTDESRLAARATLLPLIDAGRELGLFVSRQRHAGSAE
ncbi:MAG: hypothetical protein KF819_10590 [Labilithrix sp.]|nr:hypothetical protein [Labilithrix sp.]